MVGQRVWGGGWLKPQQSHNAFHTHFIAGLDNYFSFGKTTSTCHSLFTLCNDTSSQIALAVDNNAGFSAGGTLMKLSSMMCMWLIATTMTGFPKTCSTSPTVPKEKGKRELLDSRTMPSSISRRAGLYTCGLPCWLVLVCIVADKWGSIQLPHGGSITASVVSVGICLREWGKSWKRK